MKNTYRSTILANNTGQCLSADLEINIIFHPFYRWNIHQIQSFVRVFGIVKMESSQLALKLEGGCYFLFFLLLCGGCSKPLIFPPPSNFMVWKLTLQRYLFKHSHIPSPLQFLLSFHSELVKYQTVPPPAFTLHTTVTCLHFPAFLKYPSFYLILFSAFVLSCLLLSSWVI